MKQLSKMFIAMIVIAIMFMASSCSPVGAKISQVHCPTYSTKVTVKQVDTNRSVCGAFNHYNKR